MRLAELNLMDPAVQEDWYTAYRLLHDEAPVYNIPGTTLYVLSKYEDIAAVVRNSDLFSNMSEKHGGEPLLHYKEAHDIYETKGFKRWHPLSVDPPEHKMYRELVDPFFNGTGLERVRPLITATVNELLDGIQARGTMEVMTDYAIPLPVTIITKMIGFPVEDMPQLHSWSNAWALPFARGLTLEQEIDVAEQGVAFQNYILDFIKARRKDPREDLITHLVNAKFNGERPLSDQEIVGMVDHLYIGGNETTTFAITSGLWLMLREPEIYAGLKADLSKIRTFVEEVLRLESPTQGLYRTAVEDTEIRGVAIPKGATLHLRFAAANRDEDVFAMAEKLDLSRRNAARHMAFSQAEHHCPGAALSRVEQQISHAIMLERLPNLRFTPDANDFTHLPGFVLRSLKALHLDFDPAS